MLARSNEPPRGVVGSVLAVAAVIAVGGVFLVAVPLLTAWGTVTALREERRGSRNVPEP
jgi:hypothetical protein